MVRSASHISPDQRTRAYEAAVERIGLVAESRAETLNIGGLSALSEIPPEAAKLLWLKEIRIDRTNISDISTLSKLTNLNSIHAHGANISDISPLSNLSKLTTLYLGENNLSSVEPIKSLSEISGLFLHQNPISDLSPLRNLTKVETLTLGKTNVAHLADIVHLPIGRLVVESPKLKSIEGLDYIHTLWNLTLRSTRKIDTRPLRGVKSVRRLSLTGKGFSNISEMALKSIQHLSLNNMEVFGPEGFQDFLSLRELILRNVRIDNLDGIRNHMIRKLDISSSQIRDFSAIGYLTSLSDAAIDSRVSGIRLTQGSAPNDQIKKLSRLKNPDSTVLTINYYRKLLNLNPYWPAKYHGSTDIPNHLPKIENNSLPQGPGPYSIALSSGKLEAFATFGTPTDPGLAISMQEGILELAANLLRQLKGNFRDPALEGLVRRLKKDLSHPEQRLQIGRLQVGLRVLQAISAAYDSSTRESDKTLAGTLGGLAAAIGDYTALFSAIREMEAARAALDVTVSEEISGLQRPLDELVITAARSPLVGKSIVVALTEGSDEVTALGKEILSATHDLETRRVAIQKRSAIISQQLLTVWNFAAETFRVSTSVAEQVGNASLDGLKDGMKKGVSKGVERVVSGSLVGAAAALAFQIADPIVALSILVETFNPLAKKAEGAKKASGKQDDGTESEE